MVLVGTGDIADCRDLSGVESTAKLLDQIPGTVMAVGDLAYPDGTREDFQCYDRTWGRQKAPLVSLNSRCGRTATIGNSFLKRVNPSPIPAAPIVTDRNLLSGHSLKLTSLTPALTITLGKNGVAFPPHP